VLGPVTVHGTGLLDLWSVAEAVPGVGTVSSGLIVCS
jgi:hypothetical protein